MKTPDTRIIFRTLDGREEHELDVRPPEPPPFVLHEPTAAELATNFAAAMERWAAAGFATVTREQHDERGRICAPCPYWDAAAWLGLGRCQAPGCGCTKLKRWLLTERCLHPQGSRWPALRTD